MYSKADIDSMAGNTVFGPLPIILNEKNLMKMYQMNLKGYF
jgi:hypothetical protein